MNGSYFAKFIDDNFETMFSIADIRPKQQWIQDRDPSQNSAMAPTAMERGKGKLLKIPPRSPGLNPIENIFKLVLDCVKKQSNAKSQRKPLKNLN